MVCRDQACCKGTSWLIGSPKVVVINANHPDVDAIERTNQILKHGYVPVDAILEVTEVEKIVEEERV